MSQRAMSIDNISFLSPPSSKNEQFQQYNDDDKAVSEATSEDMSEKNEMVQQHIKMTKTIMTEDEENENIIPWKKLLRKTNSRLNLIS